MAENPHPEPGDIDLEGPFELPEPAVIHLPGAGREPADQRLADAILAVRPGLLFLAAPLD